MSYEAKQTPNTNITRRLAINAADSKNTALGTGSFLTNATKSRLAVIKTNYNAAYVLVSVKKNALAVSTNQKNVYVGESRMLNSHFVQVFNLGIDRKVFTKEERAFFMIDINSDSVPDMSTEAALLQVGEDLITGNAARVAAGGKDITCPDIDDVTTAFDNYNGISMPHSTAKDAYDKALLDLNALNDEADKVIKKVWDEVETFYNEEDPGTQRESAREWGVIFVRVGSNKKVSGTVRDSITGLPLEGVEVSFSNGLKKFTTGPDGRYELNTTLMGEQDLTAECISHDNYSEPVILIENEDMEQDIVMVATV